MAQAITADDESRAEQLRDEFTDEFDAPDEWDEDDDLPVSESFIASDMPDDYTPQFQIAGYETPNNSTVGVWWLRDGERLQVFYDHKVGMRWGEVGDIEAVIEEINDEF